MSGHAVRGASITAAIATQAPSLKKPNRVCASAYSDHGRAGAFTDQDARCRILVRCHSCQGRVIKLGVSCRRTSRGDTRETAHVMGPKYIEADAAATATGFSEVSSQTGSDALENASSPRSFQYWWLSRRLGIRRERARLIAELAWGMVA